MQYVFGIGMQSGGTTIISSMWLRRPDTDGVLDSPDGTWPQRSAGAAMGAFDIFHQKLCFSAGPITPENVCERVVCEPDDAVSWYLIVRNPFEVIRSLKTKIYGEQWRDKLTKYSEYYVRARASGIPTIIYEEFVRDPTRRMGDLFAEVGVTPLDVRVESTIRDKLVYWHVPGNHTYAANQNRVFAARPQGTLNRDEVDFVSARCDAMCSDLGYTP